MAEERTYTESEIDAYLKEHLKQHQYLLGIVQ